MHAAATQQGRGDTVEEDPHHARALACLAVEPINRVVGANAPPMLARKACAGERFCQAFKDAPRRLLEPHRPQSHSHAPIFASDASCDSMT